MPKLDIQYKIAAFTVILRMSTIDIASNLICGGARMCKTEEFDTFFLIDKPSC